MGYMYHNAAAWFFEWAGWQSNNQHKQLLCMPNQAQYSTVHPWLSEPLLCESISSYWHIKQLPVPNSLLSCRNLSPPPPTHTHKLTDTVCFRLSPLSFMGVIFASKRNIFMSKSFPIYAWGQNIY